MADETKPADVKSETKPFAPFADPQPVEQTDTSIARLRAFEDAEFGEDCVRINDKIERGSGSPWAAMTDAQKAHYASLERLVEAERKRDEANAAAAVAQANLEAAIAEADAAEKAAEEAKAKADEQAAARQARLDAKAKHPAQV